MEQLTLPEPAATILARTHHILDRHVTPHTPGGDGWKIGGGTILAARWAHRQSEDIDLLVHPNTESHLEHRINPELSARMREAGATYFDFETLPMIHFDNGRIEILARCPSPRRGHELALVDGRRATTLASAQILTAKLRHRSLDPPVRDLYDLAVAARAEPRALAVALNTLPPGALGTRLLRWERRSKAYAQEARDLIRGAPQRYADISSAPAEHAIDAATRHAYQHVRIRAAGGIAIVEAEASGYRQTFSYASLPALHAGFERDGINALVAARGRNHVRIRSEVTAAVQTHRDCTVLECATPRLETHRRTKGRGDELGARAPSTATPQHKGGVPDRAGPAATGAPTARRSNRPAERQRQDGWYRR